MDYNEIIIIIFFQKKNHDIIIYLCPSSNMHLLHRLLFHSFKCNVSESTCWCAWIIRLWGMKDYLSTPSPFDAVIENFFFFFIVGFVEKKFHIINHHHLMMNMNFISVFFLFLFIRRLLLIDYNEHNVMIMFCYCCWFFWLDFRIFDYLLHFETDFLV